MGRLRPSKRLTSTQVLSQCAALRKGTLQPINFSKSEWAEANKIQEHYNNFETLQYDIPLKLSVELQLGQQAVPTVPRLLGRAGRSTM